MEMPDGEVLAKASGSTEAYRDAGVGREQDAEASPARIGLEAAPTARNLAMIGRVNLIVLPADTCVRSHHHHTN